MKVVINKSVGGFCLSKKAIKFLGIFGEDIENYEERDPFYRTCPYLIECVEKLGEEASGQNSKLEIVEISDYMDFEIIEKNGVEDIAISSFNVRRDYKKSLKYISQLNKLISIYQIILLICSLVMLADVVIGLLT